MPGFTLAAAASIMAGLSIGAAVTIGVTLAVQDHSVAPAPDVPRPSAPYLVDYGDRCYHGHCLPCNSPQSCLNKLPPGLRP
jgi:Protein of unknown function (DUF2613)